MTTLMTNVEKNALADFQASRIDEVSLHTATPGTTGADEATGGTPTYARQVPTFTDAGDEGVLGATLQPATVGVAWSDELTFDVDAGTYTHWGAWGTSTYRIGNVILPDSQILATQGQIVHSIGIGPVAGA